MEPKPISVRVAKKRTAAPAKVYPPHEHFGSPLNICRVCGERYAYTHKPLTIDGLSISQK